MQRKPVTSFVSRQTRSQLCFTAYCPSSSERRVQPHSLTQHRHRTHKTLKPAMAFLHSERSSLALLIGVYTSLTYPSLNSTHLHGTKSSITGYKYVKLAGQAQFN